MGGLCGKKRSGVNTPMNRFFIKPSQIQNRWATITGTDVNHITRVLRLTKGDRVLLLDGAGSVFLAEIEKASRDAVTCLIIERLPVADGPSVRVTLIQGIPKGEKMELIVQKGTEIGVRRFVPLVCERSLVRLDGEKALRKRERWQRVAAEAAKQCRRADIPEVAAPAKWEEVLGSLAPETVALIPWEEEYQRTLKAFLRENSPGPEQEVTVFIGPEGGFAETEVARARERGVAPLSLGPRILRTETAGLIVSALVLFQWGDLGGQ